MHINIKKIALYSGTDYLTFATLSLPMTTMVFDIDPHANVISNVTAENVFFSSTSMFVIEIALLLA